MASLDREHGRGRSQERGRGRQTTYIVKKTVRDIGGAQYPMLTHTNYAEWVVLMKVMLKARRLWAAVTVGTADEEDEQSAMEAILNSVPAKYVVSLGAKVSAKEAWESLEMMRLGGDRVRKAKAQQLRREYEAIAWRGHRGLRAAAHLTGEPASAGRRRHQRGGGGGEVSPRRAAAIRADCALD